MGAAYEKVWIFGDNFVHENKEFLHCLFRIGNTSFSASRSVPQSYIGRRFETEVFSNSANSSHIRSTLGRIRNLIASAMNKYTLLPKYIIVVIEMTF